MLSEGPPLQFQDQFVRGIRYVVLVGIWFLPVYLPAETLKTRDTSSKQFLVQVPRKKKFGAINIIQFLTSVEGSPTVSKTITIVTSPA